jgi:hypothetical protein
MLIELKIIFFPHETFGSESEKCDFGLIGNVLPKFRRIVIYLHLQSLAAQDGSLLYVFLNCLLPKIKALRCFETSGTARQMAECCIPESMILHFPVTFDAV